jgi:hypothetical protein
MARAVRESVDSTEYVAGMFREHRLRRYAANGGPSRVHRWFIMHPRSIGLGMFALVMGIYALPLPGGGGFLRELAIGFIPAVIGGLLFAQLSAAEKRVYEEWLRQGPRQPS